MNDKRSMLMKKKEVTHDTHTHPPAPAACAGTIPSGACLAAGQKTCEEASEWERALFSPLLSVLCSFKLKLRCIEVM